LNQQLPKGQRILLAVIIAVVVGAAMALALLNALGLLPVRP
jgi:hypothetical protein